MYDLSTDELLSEQMPEMVILALLANYPAEQLEAILRLIVQKLKQIVSTEKDLKRYVNQLLFLSRLRNFKVETEQILNYMPITYNIETDGLYLKGIEKGTEKGLIKTVIFCDKIGMKPKEIANEFDLSIKKVLEILKLHKPN